MASFPSRKAKLAVASSLSVFKRWDAAFALPTRQTATKTQTLLAAALSSFFLYALAVSAPMNAFSNRETLHGSLLAQGSQYTFILLSGMLLGMGTGPWLEYSTQAMWRLLTHPSALTNFRRGQVFICATILTLGSSANLLFLSQWLNQFVDVHAGLKMEAIVLVYAMGGLTGGAWFMLLHRQTWWGLLLSCAMSMMVVSSVLSVHSWV